MRAATRVVLLAAICLFFSFLNARAQTWTLKATASASGSSTPTPIQVEAPADLPLGPLVLSAPDQPPISALCYKPEGGSSRLLAAVLPPLPAGQTIALNLQRGTLAGRGVSIEARPDATGDVTILLDGKLFTRLVLSEPSKPYFWPVMGPQERRFTRAFPMEEIEGEEHDHPHQRSFWFTHGNVNGFDFWSSDPLNKPNPKFGTTRVDAVGTRGGQEGAGAAVLTLNDSWLDPEGKPIVKDRRVYTFYASASPRYIDAAITLQALDESVTFGDTKEGTFGMRVPSSIDVKRKEGGRIVNAEGITDTDAWGKPSSWVDYTGPIDGKPAGIAILNHPSSFRYPTTWHVRDYGLFAANPFGYGDFGVPQEGAHTIPPGGSIELRYRVILHEGTTDEAAIPAAFATYTQPPAIEIQKSP